MHCYTQHMHMYRTLVHSPFMQLRRRPVHAHRVVIQTHFSVLHPLCSGSCSHLTKKLMHRIILQEQILSMQAHGGGSHR